MMLLPHRLSHEQPHGLDVVIRIHGKAMHTAFRQNNHVASIKLHANPPNPTTPNMINKSHYDRGAQDIVISKELRSILNHSMLKVNMFVKS